ncbi:MAG TPA: FAD-dependent oxidoreductase [Acidimicrobiales bacterium]|jgi:NADPH-dependent 2,4-dienoyl-CoA reductase/sulfur reductase-like enzyme|nr:FAD-dependent oxidoreductase [Acidimicrobiales bacterium]
MSHRLLVIGGDAGGMAAASTARRRGADFEIVALEQGRHTSYSACGIPYVVSGDVWALEELVVRTPQQFRDQLRIDVRTGHRAMSIDLDRRMVEVRNVAQERTYNLGFDLLHLATGARPLRPPIPGIDGPHVYGVQTLEDAAHLLEAIKAGHSDKVVVVGGGYIGLELAEAFVKRQASVTVVEQRDEVMGTLDPDMGALVGAAMRQHGITLHTGEEVTAIEADAVITDQRSLPADVVILGLGVEPNAGLAAEAGLALGVKGAVAVDRRQRTSIEGIWAAGDCCQSRSVVTGEPVYVALGTVANKQARVAGINMAGGYATFAGVAGTAITKLCSLEIGRTGVNEREARQANFEYVVAKVESTTRAGYYPGAAPITVKLLVERETGRLLGGQVVGHEGTAKRIDVLATAITARMTVEDLVYLDLSYAPPFSPLWDPVQQAARRAIGIQEGRSR